MSPYKPLMDIYIYNIHIWGRPTDLKGIFHSNVKLTGGNPEPNLEFEVRCSPCRIVLLSMSRGFGHDEPCPTGQWCMLDSRWLEPPTHRGTSKEKAPRSEHHDVKALYKARALSMSHHVITQHMGMGQNPGT